MRRAVVVLAAMALAGCGGEDPRLKPVTPGNASTATPTTSPAATQTAAAPTATAPPADPQPVLWPDPAAGGAADPVAVARSFMVAYVGLDEPVLGDLRRSEPGVGQIDVFRRGEDGAPLETVVATLHLRRFDGGWFVALATSREVEIASPRTFAEIASPVAVSGRGRGFEGNVVLQVRAAYATEPLAETPVTAGSMGEPKPFRAELSFEAPEAATGALVALTGSGIAAADGFAARPVRFAR